jgi:hypothetical protein
MGAITEYLQDSFAEFCPSGWTCRREVPVLDGALAELFGYAPKADVLLERNDGERKLWIEFEVSRADPVAKFQTWLSGVADAVQLDSRGPLVLCPPEWFR